MVDKRFKKMDETIKDISSPLSLGAVDADLLIVSWGSTYGVIEEAATCLIDEGHSVRVMHLQEIWPFPEKLIMEQIKKAKKWVVAENNRTSQLAGIIQEQTCLKPDGLIVKYDGRPFFIDDIYKALKKEV